LVVPRNIFGFEKHFYNASYTDLLPVDFLSLRKLYGEKVRNMPTFDSSWIKIPETTRGFATPLDT
jgi:hypothetical protein